MSYRDKIQNSTSFIGIVTIRDSTTGLGKTGIAAASMAGDYAKENNSADVTLAFSTGAVGDAYTSGKWAEIGNGAYYYHFPNGCWTTLGETLVSFRSSGAIDVLAKFRVLKVNVEDDAGFGLSRIDAAITSRLAPTTAARTLDISVTGEAGLNFDNIKTATGPTTLTNITVPVVNLVSTTTTNTDMVAEAPTVIQNRQEMDSNSTKLANIPASLMPTQAEVLAIQNSTRSKAIVPSPMERPDSGSVAYKLHLYLYDTTGNPESPDALPSLTAANHAGVDRSANLGTVTLTSTGAYSVTYTLASSDAVEQLFFEWTYVEAGVTIKVPASAQVVDTTAVDFTAADRAKLDTLHDTRIPGVIQPQTGDSYSRIGAPSGASMSADVAAVKTDTGNLITRITASLFSGMTSLAQWLGAMSGKQASNATAQTEMRATGAGAGTYLATTDSQESIVDNASAPTTVQIDAALTASHGVGSWQTGAGGSGTGARTISATVNDGTNVLENATVRMTEGVNAFVAETDASGLATFNLDDATYVVSITKGGYTFAGASLVVTATATVTYSMAPITITPLADPALSILTVKCVDEFGAIEKDVSVSVTLTSVPPGGTGIAYDEATQTVVSDANGNASLTVVRLATYSMKRGKSNRFQTVIIPDSPTSTPDSFIGKP